MPLRLGYVPVVLRGQRDIESKKTVRAAIEHEREVRQTAPRARLTPAVLREPHCVPDEGAVLVRARAGAGPTLTGLAVSAFCPRSCLWFVCVTCVRADLDRS